MYFFLNDVMLFDGKARALRMIEGKTIIFSQFVALLFPVNRPFLPYKPQVEVLLPYSSFPLKS